MYSILAQMMRTATLTDTTDRCLRQYDSRVDRVRLRAPEPQPQS